MKILDECDYLCTISAECKNVRHISNGEFDNIRKHLGISIFSIDDGG